MGFFDRLKNVAAGIWDGTTAIPGFIGDLVTAPINDDDDYNGVWNTFRTRGLIRGGELVEGLFGADSGLGAAIGGLPEGVRAPVRGTLTFIDEVGRDYVREPLSTMFIAGSLADSETYRGQGGGGLLDADTWKFAHDLAQTTSVGQSVVNVFATKDILDPVEMAAAVESDWYSFVSGSIDAIVQIFGDPTVIGGKVVKARKVASMFSPAGTRAAGLDARRWVNSERFNNYADSILEVNRTTEGAESAARAALIHSDRLQTTGLTQAHAFPLARWMASAETREELRSLMLIATGRNTSLNDLPDALRARVERDLLSMTMRKKSGDVLADEASELAVRNHNPKQLSLLVDDILDEAGLVDEADNLLGRDFANVQGALTERYRPDRGIVAALTHSKHTGRSLIQSGPFAPAIEIFTDNVFTRMLPHRFVHLDDPARGEQLRRNLEQAGMDTDTIARHLDQLESVRGDRAMSMEVWLAAEQDATRAIAARHGLSQDLADEIVKIAARSNKNVERLMSRATRFSAATKETPEGTKFVDSILFDDTSLTAVPLFSAQSHATMQSAPLKELDNLLAKWKKRGWIDELNEARDKVADAKLALEDAQSVGLKGDQLDELRDVAALADRQMRAVGKVEGARKALESTATMQKELLDHVSHYWKAGVLLRPAWTVRVVMLDEQLRFVGKYGAAMRLDLMRESLLDFGPNLSRRLEDILGKNLSADHLAAISKSDNPLKLLAEIGEDVNRRQKVAAWALPRVPDSFRPGFDAKINAIADGIDGGLGGAVARRLRAMTDGGFGHLGLDDNLKVQAAFGGELGNIHKGIVGSSISTRTSRADELLYQVDPENWVVLSPRDLNFDINHYTRTWDRVWNDQIGSDPIAKRLIAEATRLADEAAIISPEVMEEAIARTVRWIQSPDGEKAWSRIPFWRQHSDPDVYEKLVRNQAATVQQYARGQKDIMVAATEGNARMSMLKVSSHKDLPDIHGEAIAQRMGQSVLYRNLETVIERGFNAFGRMPTDMLSRWPAYRAFYRRKMESRIKAAQADGGPITQKMLDDWARATKDEALTETKRLMYDLAERSEFSEMMRHVMPFYGAWQEVITRWAGLAWDNPDRVAQVLAAFQVSDDFIYRDPDTGDEFYTFRLPEFAKSLVDATPFLKGALDSKSGQVRMSKQAFNMVAQGGPGFGPFVQVPLAEVARQSPTTEEAMEYIFPYGAPRNWADAFKPSAVRRFEAITDEDNRTFAANYGRILTTRLVRMQEGLEDAVDLDDPVARGAFLRDVEREAKAFGALSLMAGLFAPATPLFESPYEQHIHAYRELRNQNPQTADEEFLHQYGAEFFALTQSVTRSNNGVPPTLEGWVAAEKYQDLIMRYPKLGSLIIGAEGGGSETEFSRAVYDRQLQEPLTPGSSIKQRERLSPDQLIEQPDIRLGWSKFSRAMDAIEAVRIARGLPSLQVKEAEDLRALKRAYIDKLAEEHPSWYQDFSVNDRLAWDKKLEGLRALVADERIGQRREMDGLRKYLQGRDAVTAILAARAAAGGASTLEARSNQDVAALWSAYVGGLIEKELAFGALHSRWLENDRLEAG